MSDEDPVFTRRTILGASLVAGSSPLFPACRADDGAHVGALGERSSRVSPNARPPVVRSVATTDGQGARLRRVFPQVQGDHLDPFVLLDDFGVEPPAGFPMHPHRGFEAFTYMLDGDFAHRDNLGNDSTVSTGGVQIFTSGRGAWHSEMPGRPQVNRGLQLWVNLPRTLKRRAPEYQAIHGRDIPETHSRGVTTRTVTGNGSPVRLETSVRYLDLALAANARFEDELPRRWKSIAYVVEGRARIGDLTLARGEGALLRAGDWGLRAAEGPTRVVWIAGRSHDEPIVQRGPYVD